MPTPNHHRVVFHVDSAGEHFIQPIDTKTECFLKTGCPIRSGQDGIAEGYLKFHIPMPDMDQMGDDQDPYVWHGHLRFIATQLGPEQNGVSSFSRQFTNFHSPNDLPIKCSFPIANHERIFGLTSLAEEETARIAFTIKNVGTYSLGKNCTDKPRRLATQFYLHPSRKYNISNDKVLFTALKKEIKVNKSKPCGAMKHGFTNVRRGHAEEIKLLKLGSSTVLKRTVS